MRHGVVLSLCEPAALEDKGAAAAICRGTGKPCLPARAQQPCPPLPALLPALSPQPSLTRLLACSLGRLTAQPVLDASWAAVSPTACDTATPNVPPAVMWAPHHCGEPGLMEGPATYHLSFKKPAPLKNPTLEALKNGRSEVVSAKPGLLHLIFSAIAASPVEASHFTPKHLPNMVFLPPTPHLL